MEMVERSPPELQAVRKSRREATNMRLALKALGGLRIRGVTMR